MLSNIENLIELKNVFCINLEAKPLGEPKQYGKRAFSESALR